MSEDLWSQAHGGDSGHAPLAARMRPHSLEEYVGQSHLLAPGRMLRRAIESDQFTSIILYGPPGTGKTTLANVIARHAKARTIRLSGVESSVADIRRAVEEARAARSLHGTGTILFVDEIHRFNKAQQDVLLPHIERGTVRFIGATTHNPFFYVNGPLVSRSMVFELEPIPETDLAALLQRAAGDCERGLGSLNVDLTDEAAAHIARLSDGDARKALGALELAAMTTPAAPDGHRPVDLASAVESIQKKAVNYDADGDAHYDTASAFIKSIRGGDPDAALYWLAKMLHAGEDPRFIARRLVIAASEDIGMADSTALLVATAARDAVDSVGLPEARINLAHATVHLATAPKSNRAYTAFEEAARDVREGRTLVVPPALRTKTRRRIARASSGEEPDAYQYPHDSEEAYIPQAYLPEGRRYYTPSNHGMEKRVAERLAHWRRMFEEAGDPEASQITRISKPQQGRTD